MKQILLSKSSLVRKKYELIQRRDELKKSIKGTTQEYYKGLYDWLKELFEIEQKLALSRGHKYTYRQLALDNGLHEQSLYQLMRWKKATPFVIELVKEGKIGMKKATRILAKVGKNKKRINITFKDVIKFNMTDAEVDRYVKKLYNENQKLIDDREYKNIGNIPRDIEHYCVKFNRCLDSVDKISEEKREPSLRLLESHQKKVNNSINILKNKLKKKNEKGKK